VNAVLELRQVSGRKTLARQGGAFHLSAAWAALLLYVCAASPLAPSFTALLAALDTSHHVTIARGADGAQVVLRHDCASSQTHRHGAIARTLTFFAQRAGAEQADHVIQFGAPGLVEPTLAASISKSSAAKNISPALSHSAGTSAVALPSLAFNASSPAPPGPKAPLLSFRTTVLLI